VLRHSNRVTSRKFNVGEASIRLEEAERHTGDVTLPYIEEALTDGWTQAVFPTSASHSIIHPENNTKIISKGGLFFSKQKVDTTVVLQGPNQESSHSSTTRGHNKGSFLK